MIDIPHFHPGISRHTRDVHGVNFAIVFCWHNLTHGGIWHSATNPSELKHTVTNSCANRWHKKHPKQYVLWLTAWNWQAPGIIKVAVTSATASAQRMGNRSGEAMSNDPPKSTRRENCFFLGGRVLSFVYQLRVLTRKFNYSYGKWTIEIDVLPIKNDEFPLVSIAFCIFTRGYSLRASKCSWYSGCWITSCRANLGARAGSTGNREMGDPVVYRNDFLVIPLAWDPKIAAYSLVN